MEGEGMDSTETEFRRSEGVLDAMVVAARDELVAQQVRIEDCSHRTYHYKNHWLCWSHLFLKEWRVKWETVRVTVTATCMEPAEPGATPVLTFDWRLEVFQLWREPRIDERVEWKLSLSELQQRGLATAVMNAIREAERHLPTPA